MNGLAQQARVLEVANRDAQGAVRMGPVIKVWRVQDNGECHPQQVFGETLREVEGSLAIEPYHKQQFFVQETDPVSGKSVVHLYAIRRGQWQGRYDDRGRKAYPYKADHLAAFKVDAFAPVEPWRWEPGCDVVGHDFSLIEARP